MQLYAKMIRILFFERGWSRRFTRQIV